MDANIKEISFKGMAHAVGESHVVTIPINLIREKINLSKSYEVEYVDGNFKKTFISRIRKSGNSYVALIPKYLIHAGLYDTKQEYKYNLKEV